MQQILARMLESTTNPGAGVGDYHKSWRGLQQKGNLIFVDEAPP